MALYPELGCTEIIHVTEKLDKNKTWWDEGEIHNNTKQQNATSLCKSWWKIWSVTAFN